jgi:hypothetical protein
LENNLATIAHHTRAKLDVTVSSAAAVNFARGEQGQKVHDRWMLARTLRAGSSYASRAQASGVKSWRRPVARQPFAQFRPTPSRPVAADGDGERLALSVDDDEALKLFLVIERGSIF